jgi:hypothetical protein
LHQSTSHFLLYIIPKENNFEKCFYFNKYTNELTAEIIINNLSCTRLALNR